MNQHLPVGRLVKAVREELSRVQYKESRIEHYNCIWAVLQRYMKKKKLPVFDMKIGLNFLEEEYGITVFKHLNSSQGIKVRAINMLGEYQLHGVVLSKKQTTGKQYWHIVKKVFTDFIAYRRQNGIAEKTLQSNELYLHRFSAYLSKQKMRDISELNTGQIIGFINTLAGTTNATVYCMLGALRTLLRYLHQRNHLKSDLTGIVPIIKIDKTARIPSAYRKEEIEKLLSSVDRGNPKGRRDFAMLLLAARLGMRAGDICALSFGDIKWERNEIEVIQGKTHERCIFPLLTDVGSAIIDYLKNGRPDTDSATVFLRHVCPIGPLTPPTLHSIVWHYMHLAGIKIPNGKKHGPHALRHSLASVLLEENIPVTVISQVLGHSVINTTSIYLKIDINNLHKCALDVSDFEWNQSEKVSEKHEL